MRHRVKYFFGVICSCIFSLCSAQVNIPTTDAFHISGQIKSEKTVTLDDLHSYPSEHIPYVIITSHTGAVKDTLTGLKGVLLKSILADVEITSESPKLLSEYYVTLIASDGYKVVFSWNEIFNSGTGEYLYIILEEGGVPIQMLEERIPVVCASDFKTGRRYVQGLAQIVIRRSE
jgi:hypothetical protein